MWPEAIDLALFNVLFLQHPAPFRLALADTAACGATNGETPYAIDGGRVGEARHGCEGVHSVWHRLRWSGVQGRTLRRDAFFAAFLPPVTRSLTSNHGRGKTGSSLPTMNRQGPLETCLGTTLHTVDERPRRRLRWLLPADLQRRRLWHRLDNDILRDGRTEKRGKGGWASLLGAELCHKRWRCAAGGTNAEPT